MQGGGGRLAGLPRSNIARANRLARASKNGLIQRWRVYGSSQDGVRVCAHLVLASLQNACMPWAALCKTPVQNAACIPWAALCKTQNAKRMHLVGCPVQNACIPWAALCRAPSRPTSRGNLLQERVTQPEVYLTNAAAIAAGSASGSSPEVRSCPACPALRLPL